MRILGSASRLAVPALLALMSASGPSASAASQAGPAAGPLKRHPTNGRYFTDGSGKAVYLTGSHTWAQWSDRFDYAAYLDFLRGYHHNFVRLWSGDYSIGSSPPPYVRAGPGKALDGGLKVDLDRLNPAYFDRIRSCAVAARDRGIYVAITLFPLDSVKRKSDSDASAFNRSNNVSGVHGDTNGDGLVTEAFDGSVPAITRYQEAFTRKMVDTVNDLDNVLYEIGNEADVSSIQWQYDMIKYLKNYQAGKPKQHLVGMTAAFDWLANRKVQRNDALFAGPAEWVSPGGPSYQDHPPAADGQRISILDVDHISLVKPPWIWKAFLRGHHPILMDWYASGKPTWFTPAEQETMRKYMGFTRTYANKMNLAAMTPQNGVATTAYCLADPGNEYLVYQPAGGAFTVNLAEGTYSHEWFNPATGSVASSGSVTAGAGKRSFTPSIGGEAVLYLKRSGTSNQGPPVPAPGGTPPPGPEGGGCGATGGEAVVLLGLLWILARGRGRPRTQACWLAVVVPLLAAWPLDAAAQDPSEAIYDESIVATFSLTMPNADWNSLKDGDDGNWHRATMTWQGDTVDGVGVKRSSGEESPTPWFSFTAKPSLRLSFNEFEHANPGGPGTPGRKWRGVNRIKLEAMCNSNIDTSLMRERVAYGIYRAAGAPAPRASHARVYVNGTYTGLYTVEEPVRKDFVRYRWGEDNGNLYKVEPYNPNWVQPYSWLGTDPASYVPNPFQAETNYPGGDYQDVVDLSNILNNVPADQIRGRLDGHINVDGLLRHFAVATVYADSDDVVHWGGGGGHNHWLYHRAATNRLEIIKWDADVSQGLAESQFGIPKGESPLGYRYDTTPVMSWVPGDATAWSTYKAKIVQILDGPVAGIQSRIDSIYEQIKSHAYEDTLKGTHPVDPDGFTNQEFDAEVASYKDWWSRRVAYLRAQLGVPPPTLPTVTITASNPNAAEPSTPGAFTVSRTGPTTSSLTVLRVRSGTAVSPDDYTPLPSPFVIPAGQSSVTITVTPVDDTLVEGPETMIVTLSSDPAYTVGTDSSATVTIADDDTAPPPTLPTVTITASNPNAAEPSATGAFTVSRTGPTTTDLSVWRTRTGTATNLSDFNPLPNPMVIPAGQSSVVVTLTPIDDTLVEGDETVILTVDANAAYTVGAASSATATIADNDGVPPPPTLPTVTITASDPNAAEPSATGAFTVSRTGPTTSSLTVLRVRSGTAVSPDDYTPLPSPFVIPAGQSSVTITVTPVDDTLIEGPETMIVTLSSDPAYTVGNPSSATVTIADDDGVPPPTLPTVTITASDPSAAEPSATGAFTVTRTGPITTDLSVWRTRTGTATNLTDFNPLPNPMVIPAGQSSVVVTLTPIDDTAVEANETVILTLDANAAYTVGNPSSATVTIADDDAAGTGLSATYYDNDDFTGTSVTRTDPTVDFNWVGGSPAPAIAPDTFSSRWTGRLRPQYTETYTIYTFTNDGARLWVEGELLVDKWVQQSGGIEWSAQVALEAGRWYTVQMDHYEGVGSAVARLSWSSPSTPKQVIPQSALDPALGAPDSRDNDGDGIPNDADLDDDNDGIPDLQDPDRDGDTLTNLTEVASGSDPDDRTSPNAGGGPPAVSGGENDNGDAWINDKCGGSTRTGKTGGLFWFVFGFMAIGGLILRRT